MSDQEPTAAQEASGQQITPTAARAVAVADEHSRAILNAAFASSQDAIIIFRARDEQIVDVNDAWCRTTGYARDQVVGRSQRTLDIWRDPADSIRLGEHIARRGSVDGFEFAFTRRLGDGETDLGFAVLTAQPVVLGEETYVVAVGHDVTIERREREARERARRLEELGRLAGELAHDFNNLLTVISSYAELLRADATAGARADDASEILRAAESAAALTRRLVAFSRHQPTVPRQIELNPLINESHRLLTSLAGERATLSLALTDGLSPVLADPGQVEQVLLNLIINARDATSDDSTGGRIVVRTGMRMLDPAEAWKVLGPEGRPGQYVTLAVEDTGCGMDEATLSRIFEPFFTTKADDGGTGLGLAVVHGILRQAGGVVVAESVPGRTLFTTYWPECVTAKSDVTERRPTRGVGERAARILVVDDQPAIRAVVGRVLERAGFEVDLAADGIAALDLLGEKGRAFDLVLTDTVMPRMDGMRLAERLHELHPELPVLLMSGYMDQGSVALSRLPNVIPQFLNKPFVAADLFDAVSQALGPVKQ